MTISGYKGDEYTEFDPNNRTHIVDGPPRLAHKTTKIVQAASGFKEERSAGTIVFIANNYEQAHETAESHFGGGKYGVEPDTVVIPKGKDKSTKFCSDDCDHSLDGSSFGKVKAVSREVAAQNGVVMPETFRGEDVCAYQATKFAMEHADVIIAVAANYSRLVEHSCYPENYQIVIDEESTQNYFRPSGFKLMEVQPAKADIGPSFTLDTKIDHTNVNNVYQREQNKIDDLERVASRYRNITDACEWLGELVDKAKDYDFSENPELDDYLEHLGDIDPGQVELNGPPSERSATFERLRMDYHRFAAGKACEAAFFDPEVQITPSGDKYDIRVIPNPTAEFLVRKESLNAANEVWLVGDYFAKDVARKLDGSFDYTELSPNPSDLNDLKILMVSCEDDEEFSRRRFMTDISHELAEQRIPHPVFAGSGLRAQNAKERIGPSSYFFNAAAERKHYEEQASIGYAITSYPGSRISRGVDLPTNITIVRSTQFQSGVWDYQGSNDETRRKCERMRRYSKEIEVHNMMLRGAGQGERHVAIVPSMVPYFGLDDVVHEISIHDGVESALEVVLSWIKDVEERDGLYWCGVCGVGYVSMMEYVSHRANGRCTID